MFSELIVPHQDVTKYSLPSLWIQYKYDSSKPFSLPSSIIEVLCFLSKTSGTPFDVRSARRLKKTIASSACLFCHPLHNQKDQPKTTWEPGYKFLFTQLNQNCHSNKPCCCRLRSKTPIIWYHVFPACCACIVTTFKHCEPSSTFDRR